MLPRDVCDWMDAYLARKVKEFGLDSWEIEWSDEHVDDGCASVDCKPEYRFAKLNIDVRKQDSIEALERTVEHELLHAVSSDVYCTVWALLAESSASDAEKAVIYKAMMHAAERDCGQLERLVAALRRKV